MPISIAISILELRYLLFLVTDLTIAVSEAFFSHIEGKVAL